MKLLGLRKLDSPLGQALLEATIHTGFSEAVARRGLEAELATWTSVGFTSVRDELSPALPHTRLPETVLVIAARTLAASTLRACLMARLLGARVLLKVATGQESLGEAIAAADPEIEAVPFKSSESKTLDQQISRADTVVVLGSNETVATVRTHVPQNKGFVGYGHRVSAAWLETITVQAMQGLAADLCAWDQAGCLSPQLVWTTEQPRDVAHALARTLRDFERDLPMTLPSEARRARREAGTLCVMMGGEQVSTESARLWALPDSRFRLSPGFRSLWIVPACHDALMNVSHELSCLAITGDCSKQALLPEAVRVCEPGDMQRPNLDWQHDGRPNLLPLLKPA